jgi:putative addiction module killer protein
METASQKEVIFYTDSNGRRPFAKWLYGLRDLVGRKRIMHRVHKLKGGVYGPHHKLREGVSELLMDFGPGYRVYYGEHGNTVVILLGGHKNSQDDDIVYAVSYWKEYKEYRGL